MSPPAPGAVPAAEPVTEFPAADLERRFTAYALDRVLAWGVAAGIGYGVGRLVAPGEFLPAAGIAVGVLLLIGAITAVVLGLTALTPGMAFTGLRVVRAGDGMPIGVGAALLRTIVLGLAGLPTLGLGAAMLAWTAAMDPSGRRRARHDRIGDAVVVDVRPRPVVEVEADERPQQIVNLTAMRLLPSPAPQPTSRPASAAPASQHEPAPQAAPAPPPSATPAPTRQPPPTPAPTPAPAPAPPAPAPAPPAPAPAPPAPAPPAPAPGGRGTVERRRVPTDVRWRVTFDTGESFLVEGLAIVGRRPEPRAGEPVRHVVPLRSEDMSLSKTHAQFQVVPDGALVVMDRGSTNGSYVLRGGASKSLSPGRPTTLIDGDQVRFGDRTMQVARDG